MFDPLPSPDPEEWRDGLPVPRELALGVSNTLDTLWKHFGHTNAILAKMATLWMCTYLEVVVQEVSSSGCGCRDIEKFEHLET